MPSRRSTSSFPPLRLLLACAAAAACLGGGVASATDQTTTTASAATTDATTTATASATATTSTKTASAADEGPVQPPKLEGPGAVAANGGQDGGDDGILAARPPETDGWKSKDSDCRTSGSVTMGIGFGGGMVDKGVGATLNYGEDGNPYRPCADTGVAFSLSVSQGWTSGHPDRGFYRGAYGGGPWGGGYRPGWRDGLTGGGLTGDDSWVSGRFQVGH